jgi:hypothetical protein
MALVGQRVRFSYSGSTSTLVSQGDPLESIGGRSTDVFPLTQLPKSACYIQSSLDSVSPALNQLSANTIDQTEVRTIAVGDWITVVTGAAAPFVAKITAEAAGVLTLDRQLPALTAANDWIRISKAENIFPDATLAQASAGVVDHRMIYMYTEEGGAEGNMKYWIEAVEPNPARIEIMASDVGAGSSTLKKLADGEDNPFTPFEAVDFSGGGFNNTIWGDGEKIGVRYSSGTAAPLFDYGNLGANWVVPIWLRRTIPVGSTGGKCVFALFVRSDADPGTPDPDPFITGFVFEFLVPELTYTSSITIDRTVFINGGARVTGTVVNQFGAPAIGLNAWIVVDSGPGSIESDVTARTDENGQITATYTAPTTLSTDAVLKIIIPTNPEV